MDDFFEMLKGLHTCFFEQRPKIAIRQKILGSCPDKE
jgi:hypothetical protein